jgi:hypothetical protein
MRACNCTALPSAERPNAWPLRVIFVTGQPAPVTSKRTEMLAGLHLPFGGPVVLFHKVIGVTADSVPYRKDLEVSCSREQKTCHPIGLVQSYPT